jgi:hypothetical protein
MTNQFEIKEALKKLGSNKFYSKHLDLEFEIWDLEKMDDFNIMYKVQDYLPEYYGIGSDCAGELLVIELNSGKIYAIPFIPMDSLEKREVSGSIKNLK